MRVTRAVMYISCINHRVHDPNDYSIVRVIRAIVNVMTLTFTL